MKLNLISDIHASYDVKKDEVQYFAKNFYGRKLIVNLLESLMFKLDKLPDDIKIKKIKHNNLIKAQSCDYESVMNAISNVNSLLSNFDSKYLPLDDSIKYDIANAFSGTKSWILANCTNFDFYNFSKIEYFLYYNAELFDPAKLEPADYLLIAGDLGYDNIYDKVVADIEKKTAGKFKKVLHIAGNHDHWWLGEFSPNVKKPASPNFSRIACKHEDGDYVILGTTLWTPVSDDDIANVTRGMNDYIYMPGTPTAYLTSERHRLETGWLRSEIEKAKDKKVVVFTHHQPFAEMVEDDYKHSTVNAAYAVLNHSLDDINKYNNIKLWHCGHSHSRFDSVLHNVHVVRCPIGYSSLYGCIPAEVPSKYWYNSVFEV